MLAEKRSYVCIKYQISNTFYLMSKTDLPTEYPDGMTEAMLPQIILFRLPRGKEKY
jgi:hypothetical protein